MNLAPFRILAYREGPHSSPRWYFDEKELGIFHEELLDGVPEILMIISGASPEVTHLEIWFSSHAFSDSTAVTLTGYRDRGVVYALQCPAGNLTGWLCSTFWMYFDQAEGAPERLHIKVKVLA